MKRCINLSNLDEKYPTLIKDKASRRVVAANIVLWQHDNNHDDPDSWDIFPEEEELKKYIKNNRTSDISYSTKEAFLVSNFKPEGNNATYAFTDKILNADLRALGIEPEEEDTIKRREQCQKEMSFLTRNDRSELIFRQIAATLNRTNLPRKRAIAKMGGMDAVINSVKTDFINKILSKDDIIEKNVVKIVDARAIENNPEEIARVRAKVSSKVNYRTNEYIKIVNNFTSLVEDALYKLSVYEGVLVTLGVDGSVKEHIITSADTDNPGTEPQDKDDSELTNYREAHFNDYNTVSAMSTLSQETRALCNSLPLLDSRGNIERDDLDNPRYVDGSHAHGILIDACKDMYDDQDLEDVLKSRLPQHPWIKGVLDAIDRSKCKSNKELNEVENLRTKLFVDFNRAWVGYIVETIKNIEGSVSMRSTFINKPEPIQYLFTRWRDNFQSGTTLTSNEEDSVYTKNHTLKPSNIEGLKKKIETCRTLYRGEIGERLILSDDEIAERGKHLKKGTEVFNLVKTLLNSVAVDVTDEHLETALTIIKDESTTKTTNNVVRYNVDEPLEALLNNVDTIYNGILGNSGNAKNDKYYEDNPSDLINDHGQTYFRIARYLQAEADGVVESNFREGDKNRYAHVMDNHIFRLFRKLKNTLSDKKPDNPNAVNPFTGEPFKNYYEEFIYNEFKKYDWFYDKKAEKWNLEILERLENNTGEFRDVFDVKVILKQNKKEAGEFKELDSTLSQILEYAAYETNESKTPDTARYIAPLAAEASVMYAVTMPRYNTTIRGSVKQQIALKLVPILKEEYNRIMLIRERNEMLNDPQNAFDRSNLIAKWDMSPNAEKIGGAEFKYFPYLNTLKVIDENGKEVNAVEYAVAHSEGVNLNKILQSFIIQSLDHDFKNACKEWEKWGLFKTDKKGQNKLLGKPSNEGAVVAQLANVVRQNTGVVDDLGNVINLLIENVVQGETLESRVNTINTKFIKSKACTAMWNFIPLNKQNEINGTNSVGSKFDMPNVLTQFLREVAEITSKHISLNKDNKTFSVKADSLDTLTIAKCKEAKSCLQELYHFINTEFYNVSTLNENNPLKVFLKSLDKALSASDGITQYLEDFFCNNAYAQVQLIELLATDLAYYKDLEEWIKRAKEYHANGTRCNVNAAWYTEKNDTYEKARVSDGIQRFFIVQDKIEKSAIYEQIEAIIDHQIQNKAQRHIIKSLYREVNWTDGQAFRTLASYRKVMVMKSAWSDEFEASYDRLVSGTWNYDDFMITYQAIKPYIYSSMDHTWTGKDGAKHTIKHPIQVKDSEAALLTIYSQIFNAKNGETSKLAVINDFMTKNDIDLMVFNSGVKHGNQGVINLETDPDGNPLTNAQVLEVLENNVHSNNPNCLHQVSYKDYLEQQPVPEHLFDAVQLLGTQISKLIDADFNPEDELTIPGFGKTTFQYAKDLLAKLYVENILQAFVELNERFKDIREVEKYLKNQINQSAAYSPDLLDAVTLVEVNGELQFNLPLHDPIQFRNIQSLLNSILKNNITKQKVPGGACVQVSAYDHDLNVVFKDSQGNLLKTRKEFNGTDDEYKAYCKGASIAYVECYLPVYNTELLKFLEQEKTSDNGIISIDGIPKSLRDEVLTLIGYRI